MGFGRRIFEIIFSFKTPHIVEVKNFQIALIHRLIQLLVISYIIGFSIIYKKGYQSTEIGQSSVTSKVKGVASTLDRYDLPEAYRRMWDTPDYVIPPQENGAFFVMTDAVITAQQTFRNCTEVRLDTVQKFQWGKKAACNSTSHNHCKVGQPLGETGHGLMTGRCIPSDENSDQSFCEITGWCPVENDDRKSNIPDWANDTYLQTCRQETSQTCPTFTLGYMIEKAGSNFSSLAFDGGVINIKIEWICNFDFDPEQCLPKYSFTQMNSHGKSGSGLNFRYANYYRDANGTMARDLIKAYGILFVFTVDGKAGKFDVVPLIINIGTGLALLSFATLLCDFIMLNCFKKREQYKAHKFLTVHDETMESGRSGANDKMKSPQPSVISTNGPAKSSRAPSATPTNAPRASRPPSVVTSNTATRRTSRNAKPGDTQQQKARV